MKNKNYVIKKKYKELPPSEILRFGNEFVDEFLLDEDTTDIPINALKVIFNLVSILRNEQLQKKKQPQQLKLFEEEFASEHNTYAQMKIKNSLITRNSEVLKATYKYLTQLKYDWYEFTTSDGRKIKALGGLISNVFYEENGYTSFLVSSYWIKKLIHLPEYNSTLYNLVYIVRSNKHILFWFWLTKIREEGTKVKRTTINQQFKVNYKDSRSLCKEFLKPIRENLNKYSHRSFNYSIEGELIHIMPYSVKTISADGLSSSMVQQVNSNYYLRYFRNRHQLSEEELKGITYIFKHIPNDKMLIIDAYKLFVINCRRKKSKTTEYTGKNFLNELQEFIKLKYLETEMGKKYPTSFPII